MGEDNGNSDEAAKLAEKVHKAAVAKFESLTKPRALTTADTAECPA